MGREGHDEEGGRGVKCSVGIDHKMQWIENEEEETTEKEIICHHQTSISDAYVILYQTSAIASSWMIVER